jgi:hypothetical protein
MKHIRRKILDTPSPTNRLAYVLVITDNWTEALEQHPKIVNYPDLYEITEDEVPTDLSLWSIEFENTEL